MQNNKVNLKRNFQFLINDNKNRQFRLTVTAAIHDSNSGHKHQQLSSCKIRCFCHEHK